MWFVFSAVALVRYSCIPASAQINDAWDRFTEAGQKAQEQGRYRDAEKKYKEALQAIESSNAQDPRLGISLNNLGVLYQVQAKYLESESMFHKAIEHLEKSPGPVEPFLASAVSNLALLYFNQERLPEAKRAYRRSLALWQKALRTGQSQAARAFVSLGLPD